MYEPGTDFISLTKAAQLLDTSETQILRMLDIDELQGKIIDNIWHVDRSSINLHNEKKSADIVSQSGCGICGSGCGSGC